MVRFGVFEADLEREKLLKDGVPVKLHGQPFRILSLLLESPGEVVSRDRLRLELWPSDTHVEFDRCLNTAVNRLREALLDSAEAARYVETVPRRGYRFIAPVEVVHGPEPPAAETTPFAHPRKLRWVLVGGILAVVVAGMLVALQWRNPPAPAEAGPLESVPLLDLPGFMTTPALSPDGRTVAFAWKESAGGSYSIHKFDVASRARSPITQGPADDFSPAFSPDGRYVAYYRRLGEATSVYVSPVAGGSKREVTGLMLGPPGPRQRAWTSRVPAWSPELLDWSPDGRVLAVVDKGNASEPYSIFLISVETGERTRASWPPEGTVGDGCPTFSPDGRTLAFARRTGPFTGDIYLAPAAGGRPRRLTTENRRILGMDWTPDNTEIVFAADCEGNSCLARVPAAGGVPRVLAGLALDGGYPAFADARNRLAFVFWDFDSSLWRAPLHAGADHANPLRGDPQDTYREMTPRFSPGGDRVAFCARTARGPRSLRLLVSDVTGEEPEMLSPPGGGTAGWSPDGKFLAFDATMKDDWDIFVVASTGGPYRALTTHNSQDARPSWSVDGKWIYFGSDRTGVMQIWKKPSTGGEAVQVTAHGGDEAIESPDGRYVYFVRRGSSGIWSVPVGGGEEERVVEDLDQENLRNWSMNRSGIYFLDYEQDPTKKPVLVVKRSSFGSGRVERVTDFGCSRAMNTGCAVSPDGRWIIYERRGRIKTQIRLVEHYQ